MPKQAGGRAFQIELTDFSGGMNVFDSPRELKENECALLHNFEIVGKGKIRKRYGYDIVSTGGANSIEGLLHYEVRGDTPLNLLLIMSNGKLYTITPDDTEWTEIGSHGGLAGERVRGIVFGGYAIFNSTKRGYSVKKFNGTTIDALSGAPSGSVFATNDRVLFIAKDSIMYWSDLDGVSFSGGAAGNQSVSASDGQDITAMSIHSDNITIFKDKAKFGASPVISSDTEETTGFITKQIYDKSDGTTATDSLAFAFTGVYYLGSPDKGFQRYGIEGAYPDKRIPQNISFVLSPLVERIRKADAKRATAIYWKNKYICSAPIESKTNNISFVFNDVFGAWTTWDIAASDFEVFEDANGKENVYFGLENSNALCRFNEKFIDAWSDADGGGFAINSVCRFRTIRNGLRSRFTTMVIQGSITEGANIEVKMTVKYGKKETSEKEYITDEDITDADADNNFVGHVIVGKSLVGHSEKEVIMKKFEKIIHFPDTINEGTELDIQITSSRLGEGIEIEIVTVLGVDIPSSDIIF